MRRCLILLFLALMSGVLAAQTPDTATIRGDVVDPTGAAVPGAVVTITNSQTGLQRSATTDDSGRFTIGALPIAGAYSLVARKSGFADGKLDSITLTGGRTAELEMKLSTAAAQTEVTVTGAAGELQSDQPQLGTEIPLHTVEETPLLNRRVTFLPLLNAANRQALNQGDAFMNQNLFTTNGTGRRQTRFEIDGANSDDAWGRQTMFTNVPVEAVQEMTVLTNAFSAEYGYGAGGVVNIVTRSGSNAYHGSLLGLWRPADTSAHLSGFTPTTATSGSQITSDSLRQTAAALSGPIAGDRTHFSGAFEYSWQDRASPITSAIAPGSFVGHYRGGLAFLRLDHQFNDRNNGFFRFGADFFRDTNPNGTVGGNTLPSVARTFRRRTYTAEIGETAELSPSLLNTARAQFQLASPITEFDPVVLGTQFVVPISTGGTFTSGTSQSAKLLNHQFEINDTLSMLYGRHALKFGAGIIRAHNGGNSKEFGGPIFLGQFQYNPCTLALAVCESPTYLNNIANVKSYTQSYGNGSYTVDDTLWSLFVQDDFRYTPNLTVNAGLRYERQTLTDATRDFAPRLGFAYNWEGHDQTVIRGGFGIYYSQVVDDSAANWALTGPTGVFNYTAAPGDVGFPTSVSAAPLPAFPAGAAVPQRSLYLQPGRAGYYDQFLPTSTLVGYQDALLNPYTEQWTIGLQQELAQRWVLSVDYVGSHTVRIVRPLDVNPPAPFVRTMPGQTRSAAAANCTRPYWMWWYQQSGKTCGSSPQPPYSVIQSDVNNGFATYNALDVNLSHRFSDRLSMLLSYTWSHAIDNVDPDIPQQNPNDPNFTGAEEKASAIYDQRHRLVLSGYWMGPLKIGMGGVATLGSALPYNIVTGANNSGDTGATTDRPVVNGSVIGRNTGRGRAIYDVSPFVERAFPLGSERVRLNLRAEAFNLFNHPNFVGYSGTWGNGATPGKGFGQPLFGITNQLPARSFQFQAKVMF
ncbi:MAG TPA: TonB-dependent receptor [Terriglobales bacterium]|nr:TonB-dependent receptor [Terriglobales bacterium]